MIDGRDVPEVAQPWAVRDLFECTPGGQVGGRAWCFLRRRAGRLGPVSGQDLGVKQPDARSDSMRTVSTSWERRPGREPTSASGSKTLSDRTGTPRRGVGEK